MRSSRPGRLTPWPIKRVFGFVGIVAALSTATVLLCPPTVCFVIVAVLPMLFFLPFLRCRMGVVCIVAACLYLLIGTGYRLAVEMPVETCIGQTDTVTGRIVDPVSGGHFYTLKITEAERLPVGKCVLIYDAGDGVLSRGDRVKATVTVDALYPFYRSAKADGIFAAVYPQYGSTSVIPSEDVPSFWERARGTLSGAVRRVLTGEEGALLTAVCLGEKSSLSVQTTADFRACGLPHLTVVSGLHLSVVVAGLEILWRGMKIRRRFSAVLSSVAVVLFAALVGWTPSVLRAGIMCLCLLLGNVTHRQADGLNSLGFALALLLLGNPYAVTDSGLILSFGAAFGILWLSPRLIEQDKRALYRRTKTWRDSVKNSLAVTVGATVPLLPLLAYWFGSVSLIAPLSNLLAILPAGWMLILGFVAMITGLIPWLAPVTNGILTLAGLLARYLIHLSAVLASLPFSSVAVVRTWVIVWMVGCGGLFLLCAYFRSARAMRRAVAFAVVLFFAVDTAVAMLSFNAVTVIGVPVDAPCAVVCRNGEAYLIAEEVMDLKTAGMTLENQGVFSLEAVIVGSGKPADASYLTDLLGRVPVDRVICTGSSDFLTGLSVPVTVVRDGVIPWGDVGSFCRERSGIWHIRYETAEWLLLPCRSCYAGTLPAADGAFLYTTEEDKSGSAAPSYPLIPITDRNIAVIRRTGKEWYVAYGAARGMS